MNDTDMRRTNPADPMPLGRSLARRLGRIIAPVRDEAAANWDGKPNAAARLFRRYCRDRIDYTGGGRHLVDRAGRLLAEHVSAELDRNSKDSIRCVAANLAYRLEDYFFHGSHREKAAQRRQLASTARDIAARLRALADMLDGVEFIQNLRAEDDEADDAIERFVKAVYDS